MSQSALTEGTYVAGPGLDLFHEAAASLKRRVSYDAAGWFAMDPSTIMPINPTMIENSPTGICEDFWQREVLVDDALLFRDLARSPRPVATLRAATNGNLKRSTRFREYLDPSGYSDELRAMFRTGEHTWGALVLLRDRGRSPFSPRDVTSVGGMAPAMGSALATLARSDSSDADASIEDGPGTALFGTDGRLVSLDERAEGWFHELGGPHWSDADPLSGITSALVARAQAVSTGRQPGPVSARLRTSTGRWLALNASRLRSLDGGAALTSLVIEPATSTEIAPIVLEAYRLTLREQQVTRAVARGLSNAEIAAELFLSPHTVRDHLKAVFTKLDVSSRGELVAKLFADDYAPPHFDDSPAHVYW